MKLYLIATLFIINTSFCVNHNEPKEIELKFKLPQEELDLFKNKLNAGSINAIEMNETYLLGHDIHFIEQNGYKQMPSYLRLRKTNKGSFITLKKRNKEEVIEYETQLNDTHMMLNILNNLGYGTQKENIIRLKKS